MGFFSKHLKQHFQFFLKQGERCVLSKVESTAFSAYLDRLDALCCVNRGSTPVEGRPAQANAAAQQQEEGIIHTTLSACESHQVLTNSKYMSFLKKVCQTTH